MMYRFFFSQLPQSCDRNHYHVCYDLPGTTEYHKSAPEEATVLSHPVIAVAFVLEFQVEN